MFPRTKTAEVWAASPGLLQPQPEEPPMPETAEPKRLTLTLTSTKGVDPLLVLAHLQITAKTFESVTLNVAKQGPREPHAKFVAVDYDDNDEPFFRSYTAADLGPIFNPAVWPQVEEWLAAARPGDCLRTVGMVLFAAGVGTEIKAITRTITDVETKAIF